MILAGTRATLEATVYVDGTATDPSSAGTVTVTDEDGNTVSTGAATVVGGNTGLLRYTPTAAELASVNKLTISWAGVVVSGAPAITLTTKAEVVGDLLFTEVQARAYDNAALANTSTYPDEEIRRGHDRIMDAFETILGYPLGRRYYREVFSGDGLSTLLLPYGEVVTVRSVATRAAGGTTWTAFTAAELADVFFEPYGLLSREVYGSFPAGRQNVRVSWEAGKEIHPEIRLAALKLLRHQLVPSALPDRALFQTTEVGQFRFATSDAKGHWFGLPDVDSVLNRHMLAGIA